MMDRPQVRQALFHTVGQGLIGGDRIREDGVSEGLAVARRRVADSPRPKLTREQLEETPDIAHPIVRTHPYTGRKSLYVTAGECIGIDEAVDLIAELDAHCVRPEFLGRHKWQVGDLLIWDNTASIHLAICDFALPERRLMHRTTVIGTMAF
jgi:taurine dioxygenase